MRPAWENAWPDVLSMAIISLSSPLVVVATSLTTMPRFCQLAPLSDERAPTIDAPKLAPLASSEMSMEQASALPRLSHASAGSLPNQNAALGTPPLAPDGHGAQLYVHVAPPS